MQFLKQIFLPLGIILCIGGLGLQIIVPMQVCPNNVSITAPETIIEPLQVPYAFGKNSTLNIDLTISAETLNNISILFLTETEYALFSQKALPAEAKLSYVLDLVYSESPGFIRIHNSYSLLPGKYYLIIINNNENNVNVVYYLSHASIFYYYGLFGLGFGLYLILATYIYYETSWKKYFFLGIGVNILFFFARAALLNMNFALTTIGNPEIHLEFYSDFQFFYVTWTRLLMQGVSPYSDQMQYYIYPPFFILTLGLFDLLPFPTWKLALPFLGSIIGTGFLIFKITLIITHNEKSSATAMFFYFTNPITIFYGSFIWMNPSLYVFFVILCLYFLLLKKPLCASGFLAIATLYKQFALLFFPIILISLVINQDNSSESKSWLKIKIILQSLIIYAIPIVILSLTFYLIDGMNYISRVVYHISYDFDYLTHLNNQIGAPVNFNTFFLFMDMPIALTNIIAWVLRYYILFGIIYLGIILGLIFQKPFSKSVSENCNEDRKFYYTILFGGLIFSFCLILFYPRGSYKYYLLILIPFFCLFPLYSTNHTQKETGNSKWVHIIPQFILLCLSWVIIFISRYVYFMVLFVLLIYCLFWNHNQFTLKTT